MKIFRTNILLIIILLNFGSCNDHPKTAEMNIIFLHHSTGDYIWHGGPPSLIRKVIRKLAPGFDNRLSEKAMLPSLIDSYNKNNHTNFYIEEQEFPKASPYGWNNNPFDYYNIWVEHAGEELFMKEPTLEILTKQYQVIIFKHCYPVTNIKPDKDTADINSWLPTISNYKLQYLALRDKIHTFPDTKFILFTGAVQVKANLPEDEALRAKEFFNWVRNEWDLPDDNIYLWDLYTLETEGGLYLKDEYAMSPTDSHPNKAFSTKASGLLFNRIIDVIDNNGNGTSPTGELK